LCDAAGSFGLDDAYGKTSQPGHVFRAIARADAAAVFIIVPIENVMAAVFDTPVAPVGGKDALRVGLLRGSTRDAIGDFAGGLAVFFINGLPLDDKCLSDVRKVEIAVEFGCGPDFADFDAAMVRRVAIGKVRFLPVFKVQGDVLEKSGLVVFYGKVVMREAFFDQVGGDFALGQEGIGGNVFTLNIDGIQQRDGGFDFVGAFDRFIVCGQCAYFFWV
jgi:hypothetical protein